jgi:hypothetical protein
MNGIIRKLMMQRIQRDLEEKFLIILPFALFTRFLLDYGSIYLNEL